MENIPSKYSHINPKLRPEKFFAQMEGNLRDEIVARSTPEQNAAHLFDTYRNIENYAKLGMMTNAEFAAMTVEVIEMVRNSTAIRANGVDLRQRVIDELKKYAKHLDPNVTLPEDTDLPVIDEL